jgi:hypothetical protein
VTVGSCQTIGDPRILIADRWAGRWEMKIMLFVTRPGCGRGQPSTSTSEKIICEADSQLSHTSSWHCVHLSSDKT